jgi:acetyl esterase/lipase
VPYAFLIVTLVGAAVVALAYRPIRREPFTLAGFACGAVVGELALQVLAWEIVASALFIWFGSLEGWAGWLGLAVAVLVGVGLLGLGVTGLRADEIVAGALAEVRSDAFPVPLHPTAPTWGRWWRVTRAIPFRARAVDVTYDVDYWGDGIRRHRLDVYRSRLAPPYRAPVMVYVHGGAWIIGEKREQGKPMMFELVARGWVCVAINYRLSPDATWPDHIVDAKRAVAWVKQHIAEYGGDPSFVAISGGSAGGHLAALLALTAGDPALQPGLEAADTSVQACVPFYGVMDMTGSPEGSARFGPGLLQMLERKVMKTTEAEHPELFRDASPTFRVRADAPPFFVLHGVNDTLVPVEMARLFVDRLRAVSRQPVAYAELPLAQHAFDVVASPRCQATTSAVADFLQGARTAASAPSAVADATPTRKLSDIESGPKI